MKKMTIAFIGLGSLLPGLAGAQARTWSLSKDAVQEAPSGGSTGDSVSLTNQGTDTLRLDTVILEAVRPANPSQFELTFNIKPGSQIYFFRYSEATSSFRSIAIASGQSLVLNKFVLDVTAFPVAKRAASAAVGDTMQARLIFKAQSGRGSDTLIVNGTQQFTFIRLPAFQSRSYDNIDDRLFDLRGRRVENIPEGARVLRTPLVSPKD